MKAVKNEFPNPVLADGRDDYIETCSFGTSIDLNSMKVDDDDIIIPISYSLVSKGLNALIEQERAKVAITIRSSAASYSRVEVFPKNSHEMTLKIPKYSVIRRIELTGFIIAATAIEKFECEGEFDQLYFGSQTFEIRKGDILACEDSRIIRIDDSELERPISSIFAINSIQDQEEDIIPSFDDDEKIYINLKPELFQIYDYFKDYNNGSLTRYVTGIIVYPVLIETLTKMINYYGIAGEQDPGMEDRHWFEVIESKCEKLGFDLSQYQESIVTLADKLLGGVSTDALRSFQDTLESEINNGDTFVIGGVD